jgi:hypothetical protein
MPAKKYGSYGKCTTVEIDFIKENERRRILRIIYKKMTGENPPDLIQLLQDIRDQKPMD